MMRKGFEMSATLLATIIFLLVIIVVFLLFYGSFVSEAGSPASNIFFKVFDAITGFVS